METGLWASYVTWTGTSTKTATRFPLCEHENLETLILKLHEDWNKSYLLFAFSENHKSEDFTFCLLRQASWLQSHRESIICCIQMCCFRTFSSTFTSLLRKVSIVSGFTVT